MQEYMLFDYETYSDCDLKKSGAFEYSKHPSTDILCIAYRIGTRENMRTQKTKMLLPWHYNNVALDSGFIRALLDPNVILVAHNAMFERVISQNVIPRIVNLIGSKHIRTIDTKRWRCTAAMARTMGLPASLDGASEALGLEHRKDKAGHKIMLKLSKPAKDKPGIRRGNAKEFQRLYEYCKADIAAEVDLWLTLPPLTEREQEFWELDQEINLKGFAVDRELVKGALSCLKRITTKLDKKTRKCSLGEIESVRKKNFLPWLQSNGANIKNLQAQTVKDFLENEKNISTMPAKVIETLNILKAMPKSSTAKYSAFKSRTEFDGRLRDSTIFYGAHTGRGSGTGVQPQNLFKTVIDSGDIPAAIEIVKNGDLTALEALFDSPREVLSSLLRSCIVAPEGHTLDVGDFATVEVRVLFWLAGHTKGLDALRYGADLYIDLASRVYGIPSEEIRKSYKAGERAGFLQRQLGKAGTLGAGFGMGVGGEKFVSSAKNYDLDISLSLATKTIREYRKFHHPVVEFWETIEAAAVKTFKEPGKAYRHGYLVWKQEGQWLTCRLPIGRKLYYFQPRMEWITNQNGKYLTLTYMGVDPVTRKFKRQSTWGGKLTENVVQAVSRDLLYEALARLIHRGHEPVLPVHDEIVTEREVEQGFDLDRGEEMLSIMAEVPTWAEGLPIKVEGWSEPRYRK